ncbi:MAG TPA: alcohol dehydrogenase catalytic domain-containing protein [Pseudonocardia sp.]|nr:alcohol dehydrogenase catalytic domain-containing protein [Pseudonocardia sp.]
MRAAVAEGPRSLRLRERPRPPAPGHGQTLLRVEAVGVCGSDLHLYRAELGPSHDDLFPVVLGHEFAAVVETPDPSGTGPDRGERVVVWPVQPCGQCRPCRTGRANVCRTLRLIGVHTDGALQEHLVVDTPSLVAVPGLTAEQAALVEPFSIAVHTLARGRVVDGESVVVLGAGPIGVATAVAARDRGATVLLVDPVPARRDLPARLGFAVAEPDATDELRVHTGPEGPHVVVDTTGRAEVFPQAIDMAGHGGRVVVVGMTARSAPASPGPLPLKELDVLGVSCCRRDEFAAAADLVARHTRAADTLVSHVLPLSAAADAMRLLEERPDEAFKVLIDLTGRRA